MSMRCPIGPESNMLEPDAELVSRLVLDQPVLSMIDMEAIKRTSYKGWKSIVIDITFPVEDGVKGLVPGLDAMCCAASRAALDGFQLLVLSDRNASAERVPIPSLLAVGAIHQCLIRERLRMKVAIVVETGEARVVHDFCVLLGFGADAICPYMVYETMYRLRNLGLLDKTLNDNQVHQEFHWSVERGIFKAMAKMGVSTLHSYKHAQTFEIVGLAKDVVEKCFKNTVSCLGEATFEILAAEALKRHRSAFPTTSDASIDDSKTLVANNTIEQDETKEVPRSGNYSMDFEMAEDMSGLESQEDLQEAADQEEEEESKSDLEDHSDEEENLLPTASVDVDLMGKTTLAGPGGIVTAPTQHKNPVIKRRQAIATVAPPPPLRPRKRPAQGTYKDDDPADFDTTLDAAIQDKKAKATEKRDKTVKQRLNIQKPKK